MSEQVFWMVLGLMDWEQEGDDDKVLAPAVEYLSRMSDENIFAFEDIMAKLLYDIDSRKIAESLYGKDDFSADMFLYQRCVALINGPEYYANVRSGAVKLDPNLEFEAILYLPARAWGRKHRESWGEYPYLPEISWESCSNHALWA